MYSLELSLRYSPFPLSIQKKEFDDVKRIYDEIKDSMNETTETSKLIELKCDKVQDKLIAVRAPEIISLALTAINLSCTLSHLNSTKFEDSKVSFIESFISS